MDDSLAEKEAVHEAFEKKLDDLDACDRDPDRREEDCLAQAIAAMTCGRYRAAAVELTKASAPEHARYQLLVAGVARTPQKLTREDFRHGLAALRRLAANGK